jgi:galactonate dehydratase
VVKIETDEGLFGWGESGLSGREKAVIGAIEHYAQFVIGRDPFQIGSIWQEMYRSRYFEGGRVLTAAMSVIEIALHDIKGKALGLPVHQLLGGQRTARSLSRYVKQCPQRRIYGMPQSLPDRSQIISWQIRLPRPR